MNDLRTHRMRRVAFATTMASIAALASSAGAVAVTPAQTPASDVQVQASPSDDRAEFHDGNATTCHDIDGMPDDVIQLSAHGWSDATDGRVDVTADGKKKLNVTITDSGVSDGVVIDSVVVKGADGYNVYRDPYLPPELGAPQDYISPLNNGGNIPDISHWFLCYHIEEADLGPLTVVKEVIQPAGEPVTPLPEAFTVVVSCGLGEDVTDFVLTFGPNGGLPLSGDDGMDALAEGTVCTVLESGTDGFPPGSSVTYEPPEAAETGVTITGGESIVVAVQNDFSGVDVVKGELEVIKEISGGPADDLPDSFTADVVCGDGTTAEITLPGDGGPGKPVVEVAAGAECTVEERASSIPDGWHAMYSIGDGDHMDDIPAVTVTAGETAEVTVINHGPQTEPPATETPSATETPGNGETLPNTGADGVSQGPLMLAVGVLGLGALFLLARAGLIARTARR